MNVDEQRVLHHHRVVAEREQNLDVRGLFPSA
jgi:hypothetical protein